MRLPLFFIVGFLLGTIVSVAVAQKYEAGTNELMPILGYGKTSGGAFAPISVDNDGVLQTN
jgi:ABC-type multidrug transport system permease subunit